MSEGHPLRASGHHVVFREVRRPSFRERLRFRRKVWAEVCARFEPQLQSSAGARRFGLLFKRWLAFSYELHRTEIASTKSPTIE